MLIKRNLFPASITTVLLFLLLFPRSGYCQPTVANPDPHRFDTEIQAFAEWDSKNSFPKDAILFIGSSSIRFWKTNLTFPEYRIINRGFGGSHISDVDFFYEKVILKYTPSVIVFYAGDNDIAADKPAEQVIKDYKLLFNQALDDFPDLQWIYVSIKPSTSRWNYWAEMQEVNKWVRDHHKKKDQLHYVDLATPLLNKKGKPNDALFIEDQLHLNDRGYQVWNRIMSKKLKEVVN